LYRKAVGLAFFPAPVPKPGPGVLGPVLLLGAIINASGDAAAFYRRTVKMKMKYHLLFLETVLLGILLLSCENPSGNDSGTEDPPVSIALYFKEKKSTSVTISWTLVEGADKYLLYRTDQYENEEALQPIHESPSNDEFMDTALSPGYIYLYKVEAMFGEEILASSSDSVQTSIDRPSFTASGRSSNSNSATITWKPVTGAAYYEIDYYKFEPEEVETLQSGIQVEETAYTMTGLDSNSVYLFNLWVVCNTNHGTMSNNYYIYIETKLAAPGNISASAVNTVITLSWDKVEDSTEYVIYCSFDETGPFIPIASQSGTACFITTLGGGVPLAANTAYYFKIAAMKGDTEGDLSAPIAVTTQ
jgi:hypothetical protein